MKMSKKGFTLIELMIVVAIIGILAAVAIPKFTDIVRKAREGAVKGTLSAVRSATTVYYGENEGVYPTDPASQLVPKYIQVIPDIKPLEGCSTGNGIAISSPAAGVGITIDGTTAWAYATSGADTGRFAVNCTAVELSGVKSYCEY